MTPPFQDTPSAMVYRICNQIRSQFCGDLDDKAWFRDHYHFIRRNVVLWPAVYICKSKNFSLPAERYESIMLSILLDIKRHGQTGSVRYWPGYLMKCVQDHWKHHWEEYYEEAKSARALAEQAILACKSVAPDPGRAVEALAQAAAVLKSTQHRKIRSKQPSQLDLFG